MPGRGNHGGDHFGNQPDRQPGSTLGGKIGEEVRSALRLLFKSVRQQSADLAIEAPLTAYLTGITCDFTEVSLQPPDVQVSEDPIQVLQNPQRTTQTLALIEDVALAADTPCHLEPTLCKEPVITGAETVLSQVSFENVNFTEAHAAPLEAITTPVWNKAVEGFEAPPVSRIAANAFQTRSRTHPNQRPQTRVRENPRLFALPIRKTPIPPHRFSPAIREIFRQALAEKTGVQPGNIQLKVVFERMNVAFYTSIQQDEQGNLLCVPKNELIGKNAQGKTGQTLREHLEKNTETAYLVVGFRLDNKQDIRAMVPVDKIPSGPYTQKPNRERPHA